MARRPLIAGNWKLHLTVAESTALAAAVAQGLAQSPTAAEVVVCPTALAVAPVAATLAQSPVGVGVQHAHWEDKGAFTGEISMPLAKAAGARFVIIGHSERRQYFGESDATVNKRLAAALKHGLTPIVCIGETLEERQAGRLQEVLERQVRGALAGFTAEQLRPLVIAYEPVWAIGTGVVATTAQAQEAHAFVRGLLRAVVGDLADEIRIQYGGSVKPDNARDLLAQPDVDGALVGGASLKAADFLAIVAAAR
ncbi:MAG: triose-phosphate isomerase [Planctomycetota bacterium]|nr:triose-phosphate isomerase [Planctomycetota bacterium]MCX8039221.1 triose-phosphate isomerase [Planctomycetota bacterium]MDW8372670.1 triose-phosphate isomerase [Planctomycetota bacterium]